MWLCKIQTSAMTTHREENWSHSELQHHHRMALERVISCAAIAITDRPPAKACVGARGRLQQVQRPKRQADDGNEISHNNQELACLEIPDNTHKGALRRSKAGGVEAFVPHLIGVAVPVDIQ
jgi:hypothetical protein